MVIGIVCEFDPLHRGHARLLSHARALGADTVVCAMSGSFTQRGSFAALSKTARAEMAVRCGADLVPGPIPSCSAASVGICPPCGVWPTAWTAPPLPITLPPRRSRA